MSKRSFLLNGRPVALETESQVRLRWVLRDRGPCDYCRPGQRQAARALVDRVARTGRRVSAGDLDALGQVCRCGTYPRSRDVLRQVALRRR